MSFARIKNKTWTPDHGGLSSTSLVANVNESLLFSFFIEIETITYLPELSWHITDDFAYIVRDDGGSFLDDGFQEGDNVTIVGATNSGTADNLFKQIGTVSFVSENEISYTGSSLIKSLETNEIYIVNITPLRSLFFRDNFVANSSTSENYTDSVTGNDRSYFIEDIYQLTPTLQNMSVNGSNDGYSSRKRVSFISYSDLVITIDDDGLGDSPTTTISNGIQVFRILSNVVIQPQIFDSNDNYYNPETIVNPPLYFGDESTKYIFNCEFRDVYSNSNSTKVFSFSESLGSVGWYGENYNGFPNNYSLSSLSFTDDDTGLPKTSLSTNTKTRVEISIQSKDFTFSNGQIVSVMHIIFPKNGSYSTSQLDFDDTFVRAVTQLQIGTTNIGTDVFGDISCLLIGSNIIKINFTTNYSESQKELLSDSIKYGLSVMPSTDSNADIRLRDKSNILVDYQLFSTDTDVDGLINIPLLNIFNTSNDGIPYGNINGWIEDGCYVNFTLEKTTNSSINLFNGDTNIYKSIRIGKVRVGLIAVDSSKTFPIITDDYFEISSYEIDFTNSLDINKDLGSIITDYTIVQNMDTDISRNFPISGDNNKFWMVKVQTVSEIADKIDYEFNVPFKIDWQQIKTLPSLDNVPTNFQDSDQLNDGFNTKSNNYSEKNSYEVKLNIAVDVISDGIESTYYHLSQNFKIYDYDEDEVSRVGIPPALWSVTSVKTTNENGQDLSGFISENEETKIKVTFTPSAAGVPNPLEWFAVTRISAKNESAYSIYEIFTNRLTTNTESPLIPLEGDTLPLFYEDSGNLVMECRTNVTYINSSVSNSLSFRLGGIDLSPSTGAYSDGYSNGYDI